MDGDRISVERTIAAPAAAIFTLISDPGRHAEIDGSGTVKGTPSQAVPPLRSKGDSFSMKMRQGLPYRMRSTVVEFDEDRLIAWAPFLDVPVVGKFVGGRIWRYELEPVQGGTLVRETWDISHESLKPLVRRGGLPGRTEASMRATLDRIAELLA